MLQSAKEPESCVLAQRAQLGDQSALNQLISRHKHEAYRIALRLTGQPADADEVLQCALERLLRHLGRFDTSKPFRPWFLRIVVNQTRSFRRQKWWSRWLSLEGREPVARDDPHKSAEQKELREEITKALFTLPAGQREVFVLKHIEGLSYEEIAEVTQASISALKVRAHRARKALREELLSREVTFPGGEE